MCTRSSGLIFDPAQTESELQPARGAIIRCFTPREYLACLVDLESVRARCGVPCFPCLFDSYPGSEVGYGMFKKYDYLPTPAFERLPAGTAELTAECVERANHRWRDSNSWCLILGDDLFAFVAAAYALHSGKRIGMASAWWESGDSHVTSLTRCTTVMISAPPYYLSRQSFDQIELRLRAAAGMKPSVPAPTWGVLTSDSPEALSAMTARMCLRQHAPARAKVIDFFNDAPAHIRDPELQVDSGVHLAPRTMQVETSPAASSFLALTGHGHTFCFHAGNVCSGSEPHAQEARSCIKDFDCIVDAPGGTKPAHVMAADLQCDCVFLNSCFSGNFSIGPESGDNLVLNILRGAPYAVIAPHLLNKIESGTPVLFWALLRAGMPLGASVRMINAHRSNRGVLSPSFILFGDPDVRLFSESHARPISTVVPYRPSREVFEFQISQGDLSPKCIRCTDQEFHSASTQGNLYYVGTSTGTVTANIDVLTDTAGGETLVLVHWCGARSSMPVGIRFTSRPPIQRATFIMARKLHDRASQLCASYEIRTSATNDEKGLRAFNQLLAQAEMHLVDGLTGDHCEDQDYRSLIALERRILESCDTVNASVALEFCKQAASTSLLINQLMKTRGVRFAGVEHVAEPCPLCRGAVLLQRYEAGIWPPDARCLYECSGCACFIDVPDGRSRVRLEGPPNLKRAADYEFALYGYNEQEFPIFVHAGLSLRKPSNIPGAVRIEPPIASAWVQAGEFYRLSFRVRAERDLPRHWYPLGVYASANGCLLTAQRQIEIT